MPDAIKITNEAIASAIVGVNHGFLEGVFSSVPIRVALAILTEHTAPLHAAIATRLLAMPSA
jgi:hypothetical protein